MSDGTDDARTAMRRGTGTPRGSPVLTRGDLLAGRYRIGERIGAGGTGRVYRAHDERRGVDVALKLLRPEPLAGGETAPPRSRERVLAQQVSHRHVVRIHDLGEDGERRFVVMDLVRGRSLKQVLAETGAFDPPRAVAVAVQLAAALDAAHREGVVHRHLRPSRVLLDADGAAHLTGFGIAPSPPATRDGSPGALAYLSPEQARGEPADARSDLYALGLILHEMLAGEPAFADATRDDVPARSLGGRRRELRQRAPAVPRWLAAVVERCLARRPDDRYADAGELAVDLESGRPPRSSRREHPGMRRRPLLASRRGWVAAAVLAAMVVAGVLGWRGSRSTVSPAAGAGPGLSVAVLPLADETGAEWVSTGGAEMLSRVLAADPSLRVVDSLRVLRTVRDLGLPPGPLPGADLRRLGGLLGVDRLVLARVVPVGVASQPGRVRVDGRLAELGGDRIVLDGIAVEAPDALSAIDAFAARLRHRLELPAAPRSGLPERPAALSRQPRALAAYARGVEALVRGDGTAAVRSLRAATESDPGFVVAWLRLSGANGGLGHDAEAADAARRAVAALPALTAPKPDPSSDPSFDRRPRWDYEARARLAGLRGETEHAAALLGELVARFPRDTEARVRLAEAQAGAGRFTAAVANLRQVVEADPNHPRAWTLLGRYAILGGDYRRAADDYLDRALAIHRRLHDRRGLHDVADAVGLALLDLGRAARDQGRFGAALYSCGEALRRFGALQEPRRLVDLHLVAAETALEVGLPAAAGEHLKAAGAWLRHAGEGGGERAQRAESARLQGELALAADDLAAARRWLERADREAERSGSRISRLAVRVERARLALAGGEATGAVKLAGAAAGEATAAGMSALAVQALEVQAAAQLAAGDSRAAAATATRALAAARRLAPYGRAFRLHRLQALAERAAGMPGVAAAWQAAAREVARLRGDLHGDAAQAFAALPEVAEIRRNANG